MKVEPLSTGSQDPSKREQYRHNKSKESKKISQRKRTEKIYSVKITL